MESELTKQSLSDMKTARQRQSHDIYYSAPLKKSIFLYLIKLWMIHVNNKHSPSKEFSIHHFDDPHKHPERADWHHARIRRDNIIYALADLDLVDIAKPVNAHKASITIGAQGVFICETMLKHTNFIGDNWRARKTVNKCANFNSFVAVLFLILAGITSFEAHDSVLPFAKRIAEQNLGILWFICVVFAILFFCTMIMYFHYTNKLYKPNLIDRSLLIHSIKQRDLSDENIDDYTRTVTSNKCNVLFDTHSKYLKGGQL